MYDFSTALFSGTAMRRSQSIIGCIGLIVLSACMSSTIFPINPVYADVSGRLTVAGAPRVGAQVTAEALAEGCASPSLASGVTRTDADGLYQVRIVGSASDGTYCLRVSVGIAPNDTIIVRDSINLRGVTPFDNVRVDVQR
jgi:hypothetical protein